MKKIKNAEVLIDDFRSTPDRLLWWITKHIGDVARKRFYLLKPSALTSQSTTSQKNAIHLPNNVIHILQFMTYISTTRDELCQNIKRLQGIKNKENENFMNTISKWTKQIKHSNILLIDTHT